ncbi:DUF2786 domain-containing protein [Telmatospirillum sp. J64-1]|uniref:DUF7168 domain-containing protein n=1 Tax=Telmatospirillum sp. J64-1 TaxID=2502183 RepID=UPI00115E323A|nr:DUF2786 domain-containing protein [Telmatospirillum sp. J64-1]
MELDKLKARLQALRAKTVANGCTEEEALAAAAKVAELLERHDLSLSDLELAQEQCRRAVAPTNRKQRQPISACIGAIAHFCDCKAWMEKDETGKISHVFFGLPGSVEMALYIHDVVAGAMNAEWQRYKRSQRFIRYSDDARTSFLFGMAVSIADKLTEMKTRRNEASRAGSGRDLVLVKNAIVEAELARMNLTFRKTRASGRKVSVDAYEAGQAAGQGVTIRPAVGDE